MSIAIYMSFILRR